MIISMIKTTGVRPRIEEVIDLGLWFQRVRVCDDGVEATGSRSRNLRVYTLNSKQEAERVN